MVKGMKMVKQKVTVSIQEELLEALETATELLNISRSSLVEKAVEEYLATFEANQRLERINQAYDDGGQGEASEKEYPARRRMHRSIVEGEW